MKLPRRSVDLRYRLRGRLLTREIRRLCNNAVPLERLGSTYGGWWIPVDALDVESVVVSAGVGEDVSFDLALIERYGCTVHGLDPTPKATEFMRSISEVKFVAHPIALWIYDGELVLFPPRDPDHASFSIGPRQSDKGPTRFACISLQTLLKRLNVNELDLLKMDIEGAESAVLENLIADPLLRPKILAVELESDEPVVQSMSRVRALVTVGYEVLAVEGRNVLFRYKVSLEESGPEKGNCQGTEG